MADRGRDLKVAILSDASRFDLDEPADQLETLGDNAQGAQRELEQLADSGRELDRLGKDAKDAGSDVEKLGTDAAQTADKVEASFDQIARASKTGTSSIGSDARDGFREAGEGAENFRDEANDTAREVAASFDGSAESIAGGFQEVAANAFAGFGPAGVAAGIAAAAGMGLVMSQMEKAKEEAQETASAVADIAGEMIELGTTARGPEQVIAALEEAATTAEDGTVQLQDWADTARGAGIDFATFAAGMAGDAASQRRAFDQVNRALEEYGRGVLDIQRQYPGNVRELKAYTDAHADEVDALRQAKEQLTEVNGTLDQSAETYGLFTKATEAANAALEANGAATEEAKRVQEEYAQSLDDIADPVSTYEDILKRKEDADRAAAQATADASTDATDSWQDHVTGVSVSVDDLIAEWQRQAEAARTFEANLATIAAAGGQAMADELRAKGPAVAGEMARIIAEAGPDKLGAAIEAHGGASGAATADAIGQGARDNKAAVHQGVADAMANLPRGRTEVDVVALTAQAQIAINRLIQQEYAIQVKIPVGVMRAV